MHIIQIKSYLRNLFKFKEMELTLYIVTFLVTFGIILNLVNSSSEFIQQIKRINDDLHSSHQTSLNYLTTQESIVSRIISEHNLDVITETANAILFLKSMENQGFNRLNRNTQLKQQCWLHNFYQLNALSSGNLLILSNCINENILSLKSLSNTYFHSMVNEMFYQSALGTTNILYAIGQYNAFSEQWKISTVLEGAIKHSVEGWNGTKEIIEGEVLQIKQGVGAVFEKLEECDSSVVQSFLNTKVEISKYMSNC